LLEEEKLLFPTGKMLFFLLPRLPGQIICGFLTERRRKNLSQQHRFFLLSIITHLRRTKTAESYKKVFLFYNQVGSIQLTVRRSDLAAIFFFS